MRFPIRLVQRGARPLMMIPVLLTMGFSMASAQPAAAQSEAGGDLTGCTDLAHPAKYSDCAMVLWNGELRQGSPGSVVASEQEWSPIAMRRHLRGDLARHYAVLYEREMQTGMAIKFIGGTGLFIESIAIVTKSLHTWTPSGHLTPTARAVMFGSGATILLSAPVRWLATSHGEQAVAAHNAGLVK